jgi:hypothetical protein
VATRKLDWYGLAGRMVPAATGGGA